MLYVTLLFICFIIGIVLQTKYNIHLYHSFKEELVYIIILLIIMIPMDIYSVWRGVWSFSGKGILGIHIFNLPIEEYLFVIIVPYFMLMIYKTIHLKIK